MSNEPDWEVKYGDNKKTQQWYDSDNKLHRENGPALISYQDDTIILEEFYIHGVNFNKNGPARIEYFDKNDVEIETASLSKYNIKPPESRQFGKIKGMLWCNESGKHHREDGPAYYVPSGNNGLYYLNGERTTKEEIDKLIIIKKLSGIK